MKFNRIYVEITNICNLNCSFCSKSNRIKKEMSVDEFKDVIKKIKDYTSMVYLHVKGEPLLHKNLDAILTICEENNITVKITTNGTLLLQKKDLLLKPSIKQINISLHSENNNLNYFDDVFNCVEELRKTKTIIYRLWTLPNLNLDKISTNIVEKMNNYYHLSEEIVQKIIRDKNVKIKDNLYLDKDYEFDWPKITKKKSNIGTCLGTKTQIAILSDGTVTPCCLDSEGVINLGNIFSNSLSEIIDDENFKKINKGFKCNKIVHPLCQSCTYRERFNKNSRGKNES